MLRTQTLFRNGLWMDKAAAHYSWAVKNVGNYVGSAIAGGNADPLISSYGVAHVTPSAGGVMSRMQMSGNLKNVAAYDSNVLSQLLQWLCAGTAQAVVITGECGVRGLAPGGAFRANGCCPSGDTAAATYASAPAGPRDHRAGQP